MLTYELIVLFLLLLRPVSCLGLIWQILRCQNMSRISVEHHPDILYLLKPGEDPSVLANMSPELLLNRWLGHHIAHRNNGVVPGKDLKVRLG